MTYHLAYKLHRTIDEINQMSQEEALTWMAYFELNAEKITESLPQF